MSDILQNNDDQIESTVPDPFDPKRLRLSQEFGADFGVKPILVAVPIQKPSKESWVRVHPDASYRLQTMVLELRGERESYLIERELWESLSGEPTVGPRLLLTGITRQGDLFLWPIRLPGPDGKLDAWNQSALEAANRAQNRWIRLTANMHLGVYDVKEAQGALPEPSWPEFPFRDILEIAFHGRVIDTWDHPVLRRLRGEL